MIPRMDWTRNPDVMRGGDWLWCSGSNIVHPLWNYKFYMASSSASRLLGSFNNSIQIRRNSIQSFSNNDDHKDYSASNPYVDNKNCDSIHNPNAASCNDSNPVLSIDISTSAFLSGLSRFRHIVNRVLTQLDYDRRCKSILRIEPKCRSEADLHIVYTYLKNLKSSFFASYTPETMLLLASKLKFETFPKHSVIMKEGEIADKLFILMSGSISIWCLTTGSSLGSLETKEISSSHLRYVRSIISNSIKFLNVHGAGGSKIMFGELGLLQNQRRSATLIAYTDCQFLTLTKPTFETVMKAVEQHKFDELITQLQQFKLFARINSRHLTRLTYYFSHKTFPANSLIINQGEQCGLIYFIKQGEIEITHNNPHNPSKAFRIAIIGAGENFGEIPLFTDGFHEYNYVTLSESILYSISSEEFLKRSRIDILNNTEKMAKLKQQLRQQRISLLTSHQAVHKQACQSISPNKSSAELIFPQLIVAQAGLHSSLPHSLLPNRIQAIPSFNKQLLNLTQHQQQINNNGLKLKMSKLDPKASASPSSSLISPRLQLFSSSSNINLSIFPTYLHSTGILQTNQLTAALHNTLSNTSKQRTQQLQNKKYKVSWKNARKNSNLEYVENHVNELQIYELAEQQLSANTLTKRAREYLDEFVVIKALPPLSSKRNKLPERKEEEKKRSSVPPLHLHLHSLINTTNNNKAAATERIPKQPPNKLQPINSSRSAKNIDPNDSVLKRFWRVGFTEPQSLHSVQKPSIVDKMQ
jgi:CRP-like cAMP-binding protein